MSYIDLFLDSKKPLATPRFRCVDQDWKDLESIFPEQGFRSYFLGYLVSKLRKELKEHGINSYQDRLESPRLSNISSFMSDIHFIRDTGDANVGRGAGSPRDKAAQRTGDAGHHEDVAGGRDENKEDESRTQEAGLGFVGTVSRDHVIEVLFMNYKRTDFPIEGEESALTWLHKQSADVLLHYYRKFMRVPSTLIEPNKVANSQ